MVDNQYNAYFYLSQIKLMQEFALSFYSYLSSFILPMRKVFAILLILGLIFNMGGYLFFYDLQLQAIKKEMMAHIRSGAYHENLSQFEFALKNGTPVEKSFSWKDDEKEFRYHGEMYDVVSKMIKDGKLHLLAIADSKESALIKKLLDLQQKQNGKPDKARPGIQTFLTSLYFEDLTTTDDLTPAIVLLHVEHYQSMWSQIKKEVITPPPRC